MRTYQPGNPPQDPAALPGFLRQELNQIQQAANRSDPFMALDYLGIAPTRPQDGLYLSEAGILGANRGLYRYDSSSATYTFIA